MKKRILTILFILYSLFTYSQEQYLNLNQLENALSKNWKYLYEILENKNWDFDQVDDWDGKLNRKDYLYFYKQLNKFEHIQITDMYTNENIKQGILINSWDKKFYTYLKSQAKQRGYKLISPGVYKTPNHMVVFSKMTDLVSGIGEVQSYIIRLELK